MNMVLLIKLGNLFNLIFQVIIEEPGTSHDVPHKKVIPMLVYHHYHKVIWNNLKSSLQMYFFCLLHIVFFFQLLKELVQRMKTIYQAIT